MMQADYTRNEQLSTTKVGQLLKMARTTHGLSIEDMCKLAGLSVPTVIAIEKDRPSVRESSINAYRAALEVLA